MKNLASKHSAARRMDLRYINVTCKVVLIKTPKGSDYILKEFELILAKLQQHVKSRPADVDGEQKGDVERSRHGELGGVHGV